MPYTYYPYYTPQYQQPNQPQYTRPTMLQGKIVDNAEVVKAIDIPLDGSISYFPMADGTAIISKQLQQDGTSKLTIFRPVSEKEETQNKYITENDLKAYFGDYNQKDIKDIKDELKTLKKQIRNVLDDIEDKKGD